MCPGTNEGNGQYKEAKVTKENILGRQEGNTVIGLGWETYQCKY